MLAYTVAADCGEGEEICFYADAAEVEKYRGDENPPRAPEFDQYESLGYVPTEALIANGWYLYCDHCDRRSDDEDDEDYEDQPVEHVFRGQFYFCHPDCERSWQAKRDLATADQDKFRDFILGKYPGIEIKYMAGGGEYDLYASIEFPGGSGSFSQGVKEKAIYFSTVEMEAWVTFADTCKSNKE